MQWKRELYNNILSMLIDFIWVSACLYFQQENIGHIYGKHWIEPINVCVRYELNKSRRAVFVQWGSIDWPMHTLLVIQPALLCGYRKHVSISCWNMFWILHTKRMPTDFHKRKKKMKIDICICEEVCGRSWLKRWVNYIHVYITLAFMNENVFNFNIKTVFKSRKAEFSLHDTDIYILRYMDNYLKLFLSRYKIWIII